MSIRKALWPLGAACMVGLGFLAATAGPTPAPLQPGCTEAQTFDDTNACSGPRTVDNVMNEFNRVLFDHAKERAGAMSSDSARSRFALFNDWVASVAGEISAGSVENACIDQPSGGLNLNPGLDRSVISDMKAYYRPTCDGHSDCKNIRLMMAERQASDLGLLRCVITRTFQGRPAPARMGGAEYLRKTYSLPSG